MYWVKRTARRHEKQLSFGIWCDLYWRFYGSIRISQNSSQGLSYACADGIRCVPMLLQCDWMYSIPLMACLKFCCFYVVVAVFFFKISKPYTDILTHIPWGYFMGSHWQSDNSLRVSELTLKDMGKTIGTKPHKKAVIVHRDTTKCEPYVQYYTCAICKRFVSKFPFLFTGIHFIVDRFYFSLVEMKYNENTMQ